MWEEFVGMKVPLGLDSMPGFAALGFTELMEKATDLAVMLFAQPATFDFSWEVRDECSHGQGTLVVVPAFVRVVDEEGRDLPRPIVVSEAVLAPPYSEIIAS
jgi:hypothetical protein